MEKYLVNKEIGSGSFGKVFLVEAKTTGIHYVAKQIDLSKLNRRQKSLAEKEILVLGKLKHPHIVRYKEAYSDDRNLYIVMELCELGDLHCLIQETKQSHQVLPDESIMRFFVQICQALEYVHQQRILHRDLKSRNIFLKKGNLVKLGDFGVAKLLDDSFELARTCIGSPFYISPEICENQPYDKKSDVWALGCVLFELATLKYAFTAKNMKALLTKITTAEHTAFPSHVNPKIQAIIRKLFNVDPKLRPTVSQILKFPFVLEFQPKSKIPVRSHSIENLRCKSGRAELSISKSCLQLNVRDITEPEAKYKKADTRKNNTVVRKLPKADSMYYNLIEQSTRIKKVKNDFHKNCVVKRTNLDTVGNFGKQDEDENKFDVYNRPNPKEQFGENKEVCNQVLDKHTLKRPITTMTLSSAYPNDDEKAGRPNVSKSIDRTNSKEQLGENGEVCHQLLEENTLKRPIITRTLPSAYPNDDEKAGRPNVSTSIDRPTQTEHFAEKNNEEEGRLSKEELQRLQSSTERIDVEKNVGRGNHEFLRSINTQTDQSAFCDQGAVQLLKNTTLKEPRVLSPSEKAVQQEIAAETGRVQTETPEQQGTVNKFLLTNEKNVSPENHAVLRSIDRPKLKKTFSGNPELCTQEIVQLFKKNTVKEPRVRSPPEKAVQQEIAAETGRIEKASKHQEMASKETFNNMDGTQLQSNDAPTERSGLISGTAIENRTVMFKTLENQKKIEHVDEESEFLAETGTLISLLDTEDKFEGGEFPDFQILQPNKAVTGAPIVAEDSNCDLNQILQHNLAEIDASTEYGVDEMDFDYNQILHTTAVIDGDEDCKPRKRWEIATADRNDLISLLNETEMTETTLNDATVVLKSPKMANNVPTDMVEDCKSRKQWETTTADRNDLISLLNETEMTGTTLLNDGTVVLKNPQMTENVPAETVDDCKSRKHWETSTADQNDLISLLNETEMTVTILNDATVVLKSLQMAKNVPEDPFQDCKSRKQWQTTTVDRNDLVSLLNETEMTGTLIDDATVVLNSMKTAENVPAEPVEDCKSRKQWETSTADRNDLISLLNETEMAGTTLNDATVVLKSLKMAENVPSETFEDCKSRKHWKTATADRNDLISLLNEKEMTGTIQGDATRLLKSPLMDEEAPENQMLRLPVVQRNWKTATVDRQNTLLNEAEMTGTNINDEKLLVGRDEGISRFPDVQKNLKTAPADQNDLISLLNEDEVTGTILNDATVLLDEEIPPECDEQKSRFPVVRKNWATATADRIDRITLLNNAEMTGTILNDAAVLLDGELPAECDEQISRFPAVRKTWATDTADRNGLVTLLNDAEMTGTISNDATVLLDEELPAECDEQISRFPVVRKTWATATADRNDLVTLLNEAEMTGTIRSDATFVLDRPEEPVTTKEPEISEKTAVGCEIVTKNLSAQSKENSRSIEDLLFTQTTDLSHIAVLQPQSLNRRRRYHWIDKENIF